jgi:predicted Rossmann-fold nucleotide-binding protein
LPAWIDDTLEDEGLIDPADKALLMVANTPQEVCDHVQRACEAQRQQA